MKTHFFFTFKIAVISALLSCWQPFVLANPALKQPYLEDTEAEFNDLASMSQVTSVSQLSDVRPTDWAFQALQSLVERYGCIVGYPDQTFRGNQSLSRFEFAAGLNACLDRISELIAANTADFVKKEDLEALRKLQAEFAVELATLRGRVDALEVRATTLERQQFSTTTKLNAQVITAITDTFGNSVGGDSDETNTIFANRARFNLESSFSGRDFLRVRLEFGNFFNAPGSSSIVAATGTGMTQLNFADDLGNDVFVPHLLYRFPITETLEATVGPVGIGFTDITDTVTPPTIADDGLGIPSRFGEYNPFYRRGGGGAALNWKFTDDLILTVGYLAAAPNDPSDKAGLFNGGYLAMAQLVYRWDWGGVGLGYARNYAPGGTTSLTAGTGSALADKPFGDAIATEANLFSLSGFVRVAPNFQIHAFGGYITANAVTSGLSSLSDGTGGTILTSVDEGDDASIWYGAIGLTFPDVGGRGYLPGILIGIPPRISNSDVQEDRDTAYHLEVFYRLQLNDFIAITPGFWVVFNPENNSRNDTQYVGVLRTTFTF
ncbi:MAG TPA: carbohydrate porin [Leptolyngbyaceae cyanobacterium M33_DOE_097]|uniref:SLH domain-containing protein n=1 Tax=Oscillatoriales cyanobacterium SpSt-418 TaxID=2282169 RepID=A0A7C3KGH6_9CYAN|nr:carbohydrate porin [Leptolyngbyaceae cyanobacterium M33_DOE_097]